MKSLPMAVLIAVSFWARPAAPQEEDLRPTGEELEGMIEAYVVSKVQESLDLTDEQLGKMVVAQKKLQDTRRSFRKERAAILRDMRQALKRDNAGEAELGPLLEKLDELRLRFAEEERARYRDIDALLDVRQRARYRIVEAEIQRRLQQLIRQSREPKP